jgi:hypothetical protein
MVLLCTSLLANTIEAPQQVIEKNNTQLKNYQQKIDKSELVREELLSDYKYTYGSLKNTRTYNAQLEKIIQSQNSEIKSIQQQLIDIEQTQKNIFPLMLEMIDSLKVLIQSDMPFLLKEREARVKKLLNSLHQANIKTHEKYRIILEAFKIEYDYAKTIETYQDKIDGKTFNILRLGRVALYAQSLDAKHYSHYNKQTKSWEEITDGNSKFNIRKAIKIARKQENVTLLNLPFLAKKESE